MAETDEAQLRALLLLERRGHATASQVFAVLVDWRRWSKPLDGPPRHARGRVKHVRVGRLVGSGRGAQR